MSSLPGYPSAPDPPLDLGDSIFADLEDVIGGADSKNARIEREIIASNRVKLTQYLHDVCVLFPFMRQHNVFGRNDCDLVSSERTTTNKVDRFIDILLTKGPRAIGLFHESLDEHYPAVFDFLAQLFSNAGIELPPERQIKEREMGHYDDRNQQDGRTFDRSSPRRVSSRRPGSVTIRKHLELLSQQCVAVSKERDGLQQALMQREREIADMLSRNEDAQKMQTQQLLKMTQQSLELFTKFRSSPAEVAENELLSRQERFQEEYDRLEGDYMLLSSELSAASDRICRLLVHIEKNEREHALVQDENSMLRDKLSMKEGEIERISRRYERIKSLPEASATLPLNTANIEELEDQIRDLTVENEQLQQKLEVSGTERKAALVFAEECNAKCHHYTSKYQAEKDKRTLAEKQLQMLIRLDGGHTTFPHSPESPHTPSPAIRLEDAHIDMAAAEASGIGIGLGVMVRNLANAVLGSQNGICVGDEIVEINHVSLSSDPSPLELAKRMLTSARTVTLSIIRPRTGSTPHTPGGNPFRLATPTSTPGGISLPHTLGSPIVRSPLERDFFRKMESLPANMKILSAPYSYGALSKVSSSSGASGRNTSEDRDGSPLSDESGAMEDSRRRGFSDGDIYSPPGSQLFHVGFCDEEENRSQRGPERLTGKVIGGEPPNISEALNIISSVHRKPSKTINRQNRLSVSLDNMPSFFEEWTDISLRLSPERAVDRSNSMRLVLLDDGKLGSGLKLIGGRGYGLFIHSNRIKGSSHALVSGDRIIQIGSRDAEHMTFGEATLLLDSYAALSEQCHISVIYDLKGYSRLPSIQTRDNFFVRSKFSHVRKYKGQLSFKKGDIFCVSDTLPASPHEGTWRCQKIDSKGNPISKEKGYIPLTPSTADTPQGGYTMPTTTALGQRRKKRRESVQVSFAAAFQYYESLEQVEVSDPRPVILLGAFESEVCRHLVEHGSNSEIKFAYCRKESSEKIEDTPRDKIIEAIATSDGIKKSYDYHVTELSKEGFHCMLCVQPSDLPRPAVQALDPIVLYLCVTRRGTRTRTLTNLAQNIRSRRPGYHDNGPHAHLERMKEVYKYHMYLTGEVELCSDIDEVVRKVRMVVGRQQKNCKWEILDY